MSNTSTGTSQRGLGADAPSRKPSIFSIGELLWDFFPNTAHLGGSAANVAFHAAACGVHSSLVSRVGRDVYGERALAQLARGGVLLDHVGIDQRAPTGRVQVEFEDGEPRFTIGSHAAWDFIELPSAQELIRADVICLSTLVQRTQLMQKRIAQTIRAVRGAGFHSLTGGAMPTRPLIIVDLNLRAPFTAQETILGALGLGDVLKLNEHELSWIKQQYRAPDPITWLLNNFNLKLIALTKADRGAELYGHQVRVEEQGIPVCGGDAVGAGDAFVARLAVAFCERRCVSSALREANCYAAWVASQPGAMPERR